MQTLVESQNHYRFKKRNFLLEDHAKHIYIKVEPGNIINISTMKVRERLGSRII